jgi:hypothetical protein
MPLLTRDSGVSKSTRGSGPVHHHPALCAIMSILRTQIAAWLRADAGHGLRDVNGRPITGKGSASNRAETNSVRPAVRYALPSARDSQSIRQRDRVAQARVAMRSDIAHVPISA